jgi:hypothetical protein
VLDDARSDCRAYQASMEGVGDRCGIAIDFAHVECDNVVTFSIDSDHVTDCRAWADAQDCTTLARVNGWPDACRPSAL